MFNNAGLTPSPRVVEEALKRELDFSNRGPSYYMWRRQEGKVEDLRKRLATLFGCAPSELAVMRNATESCQTVLMGLDLKPGDEILTTDHDYSRLLTAIRQRERRDGIKLVTAPVPPAPTSTAQLIDPLRARLTEKTRLILVSHIGYQTGTVFPVADIAALGRSHGVRVLVDGAHSIGQLPDTAASVGSDFYGCCGHKNLLGPIGTGFLYVRKELIKDVWSLQPSEASLNDDVRKFEQWGTHPAATHLAWLDALSFHERIGASRLADRLQYLRLRWTDRLKGEANVVFHSSLDPQFGRGITTLEIKGIAGPKLSSWLFEKHKMVVTTAQGVGFQGIRVSASVYTSLEEIDRLAAVLLEAATKGID